MTKAEAIKQIIEVRDFFLKKAKNRAEKYDLQVFFDDLLNHLEDQG